MAIVFFMGMFLDWLGIVMIVFPIFLPIMDMFGFDRLWIVAVTAVMLQTCFADAAVRLRTVVTSRALCRRRSKYRESTVALSVHLIIIAVVILVTVFPPGCIFPPRSGSILIFLLSLPAATLPEGSFSPIRNSGLGGQKCLWTDAAGYGVILDKVRKNGTICYLCYFAVRCGFLLPYYRKMGNV